MTLAILAVYQLIAMGLSLLANGTTVAQVIAGANATTTTTTFTTTVSPTLLPLAPQGAVAQPADLATAVQQWAAQFGVEAGQVLVAVDSAVIDITRAAYVTLFLVGFLLYFSHTNRRLGKDFITGGVALVILSEFVVPFIMRI